MLHVHVHISCFCKYHYREIDEAPQGKHLMFFSFRNIKYALRCSPHSIFVKKKACKSVCL